MSINFAELRELLTEISQTNITELTLKTETFELSIRQGGTVTVESLTLPQTVAPLSLAASPAPVVPAPVVETPTEPAASSPLEQKWTPITSPMVGTFYRAPAPDEAPFAEVGDNIRKGQTVCIIEAMKLMNEIESEISGQIMEIAVANGEPVEYGQTLMWVKVA